MIFPASPRRRVLLGLFLASLASLAVSAAEIPAQDRRSGYTFMGAETKAMQDEDSANPGMLWVLDGEVLWRSKAGAAAKSCADCHGDARVSMKGVAARYPRLDPALRHPIDLAQRINLCRKDHQQATELAFESKEMLDLTAYVARQSRGEKIAIAADAATRPFIEAGSNLFHRRQGQLNLSCAQCHDDNWNQKLAGSPVTQAQPTGYPLYRLEWQTMGSLQRRLRNCMIGTRAQPYDYGAPENVELELYLMWRANGLALEAPAVRP
jgi:sulfur-oxidizing protein SoxA